VSDSHGSLCDEERGARAPRRVFDNRRRRDG